MISSFKTKRIETQQDGKSSSLILREYRNSDLDAVVKLLEELSEFVDTARLIEKETISGTFDEMQRCPHIYQNIIAEISGDSVGLLSLVMYKTPFHTGGTALINELVIKSSHRGMGIGKHLIETAKEIALANEMDELEVGTEKSNDGAQNFYRKCGFDEEHVLLGMEFHSTFSVFGGNP